MANLSESLLRVLCLYVLRAPVQVYHASCIIVSTGMYSRGNCGYILHPRMRGFCSIPQNFVTYCSIVSPYKGTNMNKLPLWSRVRHCVAFVVYACICGICMQSRCRSPCSLGTCLAAPLTVSCKTITYELSVR